MSSCLVQFGGVPSEYGLTDNYCDAFIDGIYDELFNCYAGYMAAADCSTAEGYVDAATNAATCGG